MKIKVTQEHIDRANQLLKDKNCFRYNSCPVALAIKDATYYSNVDVDRVSVCIFNDKNKQVANVPLCDAAYNFIKAFDKGSSSKLYKEVVKPFEFDL